MGTRALASGYWAARPGNSPGKARYLHSSAIDRRSESTSDVSAGTRKPSMLGSRQSDGHGGSSRPASCTGRTASNNCCRISTGSIGWEADDLVEEIYARLKKGFGIKPNVDVDVINLLTQAALPEVAVGVVGIWVAAIRFRERC